MAGSVVSRCTRFASLAWTKGTQGERPLKRILIVEDDRIVAKELQQILSARGYEVDGVLSGDRVIEVANSSRPDVVLMDIMLSGAIDGIAAAQQLRHIGIPVIYVTGYSDQHLVDRAQHTEPLGFISKPVDSGELSAVVQLALFKRDLERTRERERQKHAADLQESEARFRALVAGVTEYSIFTLDQSGNVSSWNSGAERIMGYKAHEIQGQYFGVMFTSEDREQGVPGIELERARATGAADDTRWLVRKSGEPYWAEGVLTAIRDVNGTITGFAKVTRDSTIRRQMEEALREQEERLTIALKAARTGTWHWDLTTNIDIIDESLRGLFGLRPGQDVRTIEDFYSIVHPDDREEVITAFNRTLLEGIHLETEFRVVWPDGSEHWLLDQGEVMHDADGRALYLSGACVDITERKRAQQALEESEERFRLYTDNVRDYALMQMDVDGRIVTWNVGAERVLGYSEAEILGQYSARLFTPEDIANREPEKEIQQAVEKGRSADERWHLRKDDTRFWASGVLTPMHDQQGRLRGFAKVMRDQTEQRRADEQIRASLKEKEALLKEIHHRVKNNLQVIISLLRLQSRHMSDTAARTLFDEACNRVRAIGQIHELLYNSPDLARVDFAVYLTRLGRDLFSFYDVSSQRVALAIHAQSADLEIGQAIPCALIVNELVTNALKHAFPAERSGSVQISLECAGEECVLTVADDGVGLPEELNWQDTKSLGLQLIPILAEQLEGRVALDRSAGTRFQITFPRGTLRNIR